ncbi:MAG: Gfo/Idh/MocA family oxidoreductase, partial [Deltaproteobacteria bacterium]
MRPLNIVVIGSGMYVCGRGTESAGTIMPAIFEWGRTHPIHNIWVVATDPNRLMISKERIERLKLRMGVASPVSYAPLEIKDEKAYEKIIQNMERPACAIVVVPDHLHEPITSYALKHRLHALVVKPLTANIRQALSLIELQRANGVYGAVEFHKRYDEANLKLREVIQQGAIGDPLYAVVEYSQRKTIPEEIFRGWIPHTNIFQYLGVHYVDILYFVTGAKPLKAMATGQKNWLISKGMDTYDAIQAVIEWELPSKKHFTSHLLTNWIDPRSSSAMSDQKIKIIGTKGRFESDQ